MTTHIFLQPPPDFEPIVEASGVFCEHAGRILLLKRHEQKLQGLRWGIPGGKLEKSETPIVAAARELAEETGIISSTDMLTPVAPFYIRRPGIDFIFHMFFLPLPEMPLLQVAPDESIDAAWVTLQEGLQLPLIAGGEEALEYFFLWRKT